MLGTTIRLNETPYTIVGVMSREFDFPPPISLEGPPPAESSALWVTFRRDMAGGNRRGHFMLVLARLRSDVSVIQAQSEMQGIAARLQQEYPESNTNWNVTLVPFDQQVLGDVRTTLLVLLGAVGFVLLIACANIANLLMARGATRQREFATRTSLGAGRGLLVRQLMVESLVLALLGGALGLLVAWLGVETLVRLAPGYVPRMGEVAINLTVAGFAFGISILAGLIFGIVPALQGFVTNLAQQLREGAHHATSGSGSTRFRSSMVVAEVALSLILLVGAGLLIRSFAQLRGLDIGFDTRNVVTMNVALMPTAYQEPELRMATYREFEERLNALPGVESAGFVIDIPLAGDRGGTGFMFEEEPPPQTMADLHMTNVTIVTPGYFRAMSIPLLFGRHLSLQDNMTSEPVVIVNETWVKAYSPDRDPVGRRIRVFDFEVLRRVVGVVGDVRHSNLKADPTPIIYGPYHQSNGSREMALALLTSGSLESAVTAARNTIGSIDPSAPIYDVRPLSRVLSDAVSAPRFTAILVALFSAVALAMASVGLYGVIRYSVSQRTREIGVRVALGAGKSEIIRLILGRGLMLTLFGVAIGLLGALGLTRLISTQLFNVNPTDPTTLVLVALLLTAVSLVASFLPAWRATRVDPVRALRQE